MKKIYSRLSIILTLCLMSVLVSCEKDKEMTFTNVTISDEQVIAAYDIAVIEATISSEATIRNAFVQYATTKDFEEYNEVAMLEDKSRYIAILTDLQDNTTYYYRYMVSNRFSAIVLENIHQLTTLQATVPSVKLDTILSVGDTYAQVQVALEFDGGASVTDMGVCWGTQANPTIEDIHKSTKDTVAVLDIPSLQSNTQYYVRAYAVNKVGVAYSEELVFKTYALPEVRTEEVLDIRLNSAQLMATLLFDGNDSTTVKGFCWSTTQEPTMSDNHIIVESESANYTCLIADLLAETQYYVRAFAQNKIGVAYGEEKSFKTQKTLPILTTSDVTEITETSVTIRGYVISDGGSEIIERGVVYNTSQSPTIDDNKITAGSGKGEFYCKLEDLQKGVVYYVRAYAVNEIGIAYGTERSFMTDIPLTPADGTENGYGYVDLGLSVKWATMNVGATKPEEYGNYYAWGEIEIKDTYSWYFYKYCEGASYSLTKYNTSAYDGTKDDKITLETMDDVASVNWGGSWRMPTEKEIAELREKCTCSWTGINGVLGYKITSKSNGKSIFLPAAGFRDNSSLISAAEYGYYWSNSLNTDISSYARSLWFSSYSINVINEDRCYGLSIRSVCDEVTVQAQKPTITTTIATQITETTAVAGGNVTSDGGESVTERGVVYATTQNPTTANNKVSGGAGTGLFTCNLTDLQPNTQYYVRAYAVNSKGTAYGEEVSFSTEEEVVAIPEYVDLGLSVKWATFNVGATKPEEFGDYFAWGESEPKEKYDWSTYKWCNGTDANMTKYNATDGKIILELEDDAAYMNWGGNWRIPTMDEMNELSYQCTWTVINKNGVNGYKVTSKSNSNSIFIPFAGYYNGSLFTDVDVNGYYWSSVLQSNGHPNFAWRVCMKGFTTNTCNKCLGHSIRPVYGEYITYNTPTITTNIPTQITSTTAVAGGNVTSDGNASVTERGVVYATTQNPTTADNKVSNGSGMGTFTCNLIDLQPNTSYYIRAYAINEKGTAYGEEVTFTTNKQIILPSVITATVTQITETSALAGGNVTSDGGASVTERGVVYATTQNPTTNNTKVTSGTGIGSFTCNLTDLQPNTTYYVRAYAINEKGTVYGEELSFTTDEPVNIPSNGIENGYEWVDLGLSVKWATCNVGASKPEEYGDYYKWSTSLFSSDIANITLGGKWRTPTNRELNELINNSIWTWNSTSKGYIVTSKKNDNTIFLPAAGFDEGEKGKNGYYWTSTIHETLNQNAYVLYFNTSNIDIMYLSYNYYYSIRPVCP